MTTKPNLLINLPKGFFKTPAMAPVFKRLGAIAEVRRRSHNTHDEIAKDLAWADAVIMWSWPAYTPELLARAPKLAFSGHLDINQAGARVALAHGLPVSLSKKAWGPSVAEMALTLILTTLRKTSSYHAAMRVGKEAWVADFPIDIDTDERQLTGRPVGIVGFGAVGQRVAELLAPFRCQVRVYDPFLPAEIAERAGASRVELMDLIRNSDVVVLCAASNPGTASLLGKRELAAFRKGAVLVNVARAALVDTAALVARLKKNDFYAAIDVFDLEPLARNSPLRKLPNAFLTPHRAGGVMESVVRIVSWLADDFEAHLAGKPRAHALSEKQLPALDA